MEYIAGSVMTTNLVCIPESQSVSVAENLMKINEVRHLPVVNSKNELSGIVSMKDVLRTANKHMSVRGIMSRSIRSLQKNENLKYVIEIMLRDKINSVLVLDGEEVAGIVTTEDLLKMLSKVINDYELNENIEEIRSIFDESWGSLT